MLLPAARDAARWSGTHQLPMDGQDLETRIESAKTEQNLRGCCTYTVAAVHSKLSGIGKHRELQWKTPQLDWLVLYTVSIQFQLDSCSLHRYAC